VNPQDAQSVPLPSNVVTFVLSLSLASEDVMHTVYPAATIAKQ
jgi:hypothetical protein